MRNRLEKLDYKNSIAFTARNASKILEKALDTELMHDYGLSGSQWKVVAALAIEDGRTQKELAEFLMLDASTLVPFIDKLEQNQFVIRKPDPKDRRNNRIFITPKAESITESVMDAIVNLRKAIYKNISSQEIETARIVLEKIISNSEMYISEISENARDKKSSNRKNHTN